MGHFRITIHCILGIISLMMLAACGQAASPTPPPSPQQLVLITSIMGQGPSLTMFMLDGINKQLPITTTIAISDQQSQSNFSATSQPYPVGVVLKPGTYRIHITAPHRLGQIIEVQVDPQGHMSLCNQPVGPGDQIAVYLLSGEDRGQQDPYCAMTQ